MPDPLDAMGARARLTAKLRDASGAAIALVALAMVALLSAVALAVDVGMMVTARTEAQTLADASAHHGARVLRDTNGDSAQAHDSTVAVGSATNQVRGNRQNLVLNAFQQVMASDPDLEWCETCADDVDQGCVVESGSDECYGGESLRVRSVPIVDPETVFGQGANKHGEVTGFVGVFIDKVASSYAGGGPGPPGGNGPPGLQSVYIRLMVTGGSGSGTDDGGDEAGLVKTIQLIE